MLLVEWHLSLHFFSFFCKYLCLLLNFAVNALCCLSKSFAVFALEMVKLVKLYRLKHYFVNSS